MTLGIRGRLLLISLGLIVLSFSLGYAYVLARVEALFLNRARESVSLRSDLVAPAIAAVWPTSRDKLAPLTVDLARKTRARVSVFDARGSLVTDSGGEGGTLGAPNSAAEFEQWRAAGSKSKLLFVNDGSAQALVPIASEEARAWVRVSEPLTELNAARESLVSFVLAAAVLAAAAAVVMSSVAASIASRSAHALTAVARQMADGELALRPRIQAQDDFGELARALDQLGRGVAHSLADIREERDRLSGILSGMQEGVLLLDSGGRIVLVNPALREMLLLGTDAVRKTLLEAIRHAELKELLDQARRSLEPAAREIDMGGIKPRRLLVRVAALPGEQGQIFAVFVDVTEIRRLESMRRDFVANVSHELRTPVTAIRSAAETLQHGIPEDPRVLTQFIGIIERNAARLQDLVEDVLNLSRIESRELRLQMEPLDLRSNYAQVLSLFRERAERRGILLSNEAHGDLPRVVADRRAMEHVLTNLVDNAVKYCTPNSRVRVGALEFEDTVKLFVSDDGPGIDPRHLPRIFERFYRVDAGRSRELGGTGLGLSIVKHLVEAMGGSVQVESAPSRGTTFSFTLRKVVPEVAQAVA